MSDSALPLPTQPRPAQTPPIITSSLGPNRSTSHPSNGTSQVSRRTKTVKVTWTAACSARKCFCRGGTNNVHPYWKFATAIMLRTLKKRMSQRFSKKRRCSLAGWVCIGAPRAWLSFDVERVIRPSGPRVFKSDAGRPSTLVGRMGQVAIAALASPRLRAKTSERPVRTIGSVRSR